MPFMKGSLPNDLFFAVYGLQQSALDAMSGCRDKLAGNGGAAGAALTRWFGDNSPAFARQMKEKVAKMRGVLNSQQIELTTSMQGGDVTENASATHFTGGIFGGGSGAVVGRMTSSLTSMNISPNFKNLPQTAAGVAAAWVGQDKLETILHELSHYVWGTADELLDNGTTAYEGQNARLLATQSSARAKNNAENWGFFIEELK